MFNNSSISAVTVTHCSVSNFGSYTQRFKSPKTKTETKTCKTGLETSRDQDSSLENSKSALGLTKPPMRRAKYSEPQRTIPCDSEHGFKDI